MIHQDKGSQFQKKKKKQNLFKNIKKLAFSMLMCLCNNNKCMRVSICAQKKQLIYSNICM